MKERLDYMLKTIIRSTSNLASDRATGTLNKKVMASYGFFLYVALRGSQAFRDILKKNRVEVNKTIEKFITSTDALTNEGNKSLRYNPSFDIEVLMFYNHYMGSPVTASKIEALVLRVALFFGVMNATKGIPFYSNTLNIPFDITFGKAEKAMMNDSIAAFISQDLDGFYTQRVLEKGRRK